jgi:hypothetical protein
MAQANALRNLPCAKKARSPSSGARTSALNVIVVSGSYLLPRTTSPLERLGTLGVHPRLPGPVIGPLLMLVRAYHPAGGDVNGRIKSEPHSPRRFVAWYFTTRAQAGVLARRTIMA